MRNFNLLIIGLLFILPLEAEVIKGRVSDIKTGNPLFNAHLFLKGTGLGATTDKEGRYFIFGVPPGRYELIATMVGYKKETRMIEVLQGKEIAVDFKLRVSPILLDEIVVSATKTPHLLDDVPIPSIVVSKEDMDRHNALDVGEALKYLTGIQLSSSFAPMGSDVLRIQGLASRYTLILLDGERVGGRYPLTQVPTDMIERIELVKGPSSVLYGSDAIGGICNIITKALPKKPFLKVTLSYGSYDAKTLGITHGAKFKRFGYLVSAQGNRTAGEEGKRNWYNAENIFAKFGWERDTRNSWNIKGGYYNEDLSLRKGRKFNFGLEGKFSDFIVKGYRMQYHDETNVGGSLTATVTDGETNRGEVRWAGKIFKSHFITFGIEGLYERIRGGDLPGSKTQYTGSSYLQDEITFKPFTLLIASRLDYHSIWRTHFNPKLAVLYKITDWFLIRASVGNAFKAPTFKELYRQTRHKGGGGFWIKGNPELKPELSTGYNLELKSKLRDILYGKISLFRHNLEDMIQGFWAEPGSVYSYQNIGSAFTQGVEIEVKSRFFIEELTGIIKYSFLKTKDKEIDKELTYSPHHRANAEVDYYNRRLGFNLTLIEEYVGTRFEDSYNEEKLPHYFLTHLRANKTFLGKARLFLTIDNLFGKEYQDLMVNEAKRIYRVGLAVRF